MKMEKPTVEAVRFTSADVIATSGQLGVKLSGFGGLDKSDWENNTFTVGGTDYTPVNSSEEALIEALERAGQTPGLTTMTTIFYSAYAGDTPLYKLWFNDSGPYVDYNGTYRWLNDRWEWSSN